MTKQPKTLTLATDKQIAQIKKHVREYSPAYAWDFLCMVARIENDAKTIEALAGTGFTSGCADGHPEIRYQGAECPLCEANQSRHEAVKRWEAVALELEQERDAARADLSRPSSDPGAKPRLPKFDGAALGRKIVEDAFVLARAELRKKHAVNRNECYGDLCICVEPKPGAGEVGK